MQKDLPCAAIPAYFKIDFDRYTASSETLPIVAFSRYFIPRFTGAILIFTSLIASVGAVVEVWIDRAILVKP